MEKRKFVEFNGEFFDVNEVASINTEDRPYARLSINNKFGNPLVEFEYSKYEVPDEKERDKDLEKLKIILSDYIDFC